MGSGFRKKGKKSYAIERYPKLKEELSKQNPKLTEWQAKKGDGKQG